MELLLDGDVPVDPAAFPPPFRELTLCPSSPTPSAPPGGAAASTATLWSVYTMAARDPAMETLVAP